VILVVGLGNPGDRYLETRHNVGFKAIDQLAAELSTSPFRARFGGEFSQGEACGQPIGLLKPLTFMNESGRAVQPAAAFYKLDPAHVLVAHDELDVPFGELRLKLGGGDAGHRGLKSVTEHLASSEYVRLRIGIGRPAPEFRGSVRDFVLQGFPSAERAELALLIGRAVEALKSVVCDGLERAMNRTNQRMLR
jgi:peptidyl-tRNA hydrolase, PTH1 family